MRRVALSFVVLSLGCARTAPPEGATRAAPTYVVERGLPGPATLAFELPQGGVPTLLDAPFPSLLFEREGRPSLAGFPGARLAFFRPYVEEAERRGAWGRVPMIYFRLSGDAALHDVAAHDAMTSPTAGIGLIELGDHGEIARRVPVALRRFDHETRLVPRGLLALAPSPGFVLAPGRLHAAYVRRSLSEPPLGTTDLLEHVKSTAPRAEPAEEALRRAHQPVLDTLERAGVPRGDVAGLAVFRTGSPESYAARTVAAVAREAALPPLPGSTAVYHDTDAYTAVAGVYCTPNVQDAVDRAPFLDGGGDPALTVVPAGVLPDCGTRLRARFVLSLPKTPMPPGGFPFVVSAHGTTGSAATMLGTHNFAELAAKEGIAVVSTDQPLHGRRGDPAARPGVGAPVEIRVGPLSIPIKGLSSDLLFYNPIRPAASLGNMMQAVADAAYLARAFRGLRLATLGLPPALGALRLSSAPPTLAGHSQGSQSLAILGAVLPETPGVVLSGCGGEIRFGALANQEFTRLRGLLEPLLGLEPGELRREHPLLALAEWVAEPADPIVYAPAYTSGRAHVLHVGGVGDTFNPEIAAHALAVALRAVPVAPSPVVVPELGWLGLAPADVVSGAPTLAYASFVPAPGRNGHFVAFEVPAARASVSRFLGQVSRGERVVVRR